MDFDDLQTKVINYARPFIRSIFINSNITDDITPENYDTNKILSEIIELSPQLMEYIEKLAKVVSGEDKFQLLRGAVKYIAEEEGLNPIAITLILDNVLPIVCRIISMAAKGLYAINQKIRKGCKEKCGCKWCL